MATKKPAAKKAVKKEEPKKAAKPAAKKAEPKVTAKPKPAEKKAEPKKAAAKPAAKKDDGKRGGTYVVKKRASDNKWEVRHREGEKAIKLFNTKEEATEYTKKMAANQGSAIVFHLSKGKNKGKFSKN